MKKKREKHVPNDAPLERNKQDFLIGGREMGALMRALDWAKTPIGPVEQWPDASTLSICLSARFPMAIY